MTEQQRRDQRRPLRALVDESANQDNSFYLLTAAVVDHTSRSFTRLMKDLNELAHAQHKGQLHANRMSPASLAQVEQAIADSDAVKFLSTVRAPVDHRGTEAARQWCLAHLAVELATRLQVGEMIMHSRQGHPGFPEPDLDPLDVATVMALKGTGELSPHFSIRHRHDQDFHPLWIPDVAAYAQQQAINRGAPERLQRLAEKSIAVEATRLPIDQRPRPGVTYARPSGLSERLDQLRTLGREVASRVDRDSGYQTGEQDRVQAAQDRLVKAREHLSRIDQQLERVESRTGHPVPTLSEFVRPETGRDR